jgi:predicted transcriptional regulator
MRKGYFLALEKWTGHQRIEGNEKLHRSIAIGRTLTLTLLFSTALLVLPIPFNENVSATLWNPVFEISTDSLIENEYDPSIAVDNGRVHVVWGEGKNGDQDIFYRLFDGTSWQPELDISTDVGTEGQQNPSIVAVGDMVYVVWTDEKNDIRGDIYYRSFNGTDWQPELEISTDVGNTWQDYPSIAVDNGRVHVAWVDMKDGDHDIYYRHFNGTNWEPELQISSDSGTESQYSPSIAVVGEKVHVVWEDRDDGDWDIYYRHFNGTGWEPELEISTDDGVGLEEQWCASVAAEGDNVYLVWEDSEDGNLDIFYRYFDGAGWQPEQELSSDFGGSWRRQPAIVVESGRVHVAWEDRPTGVDSADIYYRYFDGYSWLPEEDVSADPGLNPQKDASIAVDGDRVHVAWIDGRDGDRDIYYRWGEIEDLRPPESNANLVTQYWKTTLTFDVEWMAEDDWELANVSLYYRYSLDNSSWQGWEEWSFDDSISGTSAAGTFSFNAQNGDGFYEFYTIAIDLSGNPETPLAVADAIAGLDTTPPTGSIIINGGDPWTIGTSATLELTSSDILSGVSEVRYSNDGVWDTEPWKIPSAAEDWTFASGDGTKTVYFQILDLAGLESITYSDEIGLDSEPPTGSVLINHGDAQTTSTSVNLTLTFADAISGVYQLRFSNDGVWDTEHWEMPSLTKTWTLEEGDGARTVYLQIKDHAGLVSITYEDSISIQTLSEQFPHLPIVAVVISVFIVTVATVLFLESVKCSFLNLILPLYIKLKKEKVLDHETRGLIRGYIIANPGDNFNSIKKALDLKNGTLAHHLSVLEREDFIKSVKDGQYRRFYPPGARVSDGAFPSKIEMAILESLEETPGSTQKDIAKRLGVSQPAVSYHMAKLIKLNKVRCEKSRMSLRYYAADSS